MEVIWKSGKKINADAMLSLFKFAMGISFPLLSIQKNLCRGFFTMGGGFSHRVRATHK